MHLYEIDSQIKIILSQIEENEGEITPELEQELEALEIDRATKIDNYGFYYINLNSQLEAMQAEAARISDRWKLKIGAKEKEIAAHLEMLQRYMDKGEKHKSDFFTVENKESTKTDIYDPELVPQ